MEQAIYRVKEQDGAPYFDKKGWSILFKTYHTMGDLMVGMEEFERDILKERLRLSLKTLEVGPQLKAFIDGELVIEEIDLF